MEICCTPSHKVLKARTAIGTFIVVESTHLDADRNSTSTNLSTLTLVLIRAFEKARGRI